jgi:hypothetical protein
MVKGPSDWSQERGGRKKGEVCVESDGVEAKPGGGERGRGGK